MNLDISVGSKDWKSVYDGTNRTIIFSNTKIKENDKIYLHDNNKNVALYCVVKNVARYKSFKDMLDNEKTYILLEDKYEDSVVAVKVI